MGADLGGAERAAGTNGKDGSGRIRIRCSDPKSFYLKTVENAVLPGLEAEMRRGQMIAE